MKEGYDSDINELKKGEKARHRADWEQHTITNINHETSKFEDDN